jgi:hypothetical protein
MEPTVFLRVTRFSEYVSTQYLLLLDGFEHIVLEHVHMCGFFFSVLELPLQCDLCVDGLSQFSHLTTGIVACLCQINALSRRELLLSDKCAIFRNWKCIVLLFPYTKRWDYTSAFLVVHRICLLVGIKTNT